MRGYFSMKTILIACLFLANSACYADEWDKTDIALATVAVGATLIDWRQTQYALDHTTRDGKTYQEGNILLGSSPSKMELNAYMGAVVVGEVLIANALPSGYRKVFLGAVGALEINVTAGNRSAGVKFSLPF